MMVIQFIQNLMLNLNLKSDIQKNIYIKRLKTKNGQTEFDRVPTLVLRFSRNLKVNYTSFQLNE
jgi:hypothetical protein